MSKCIIVISGKKGSGKDTLANMLAAAYWNIRYGGNGYYMAVGKNGTLVRCPDGVPPILGDKVDLRTVVGSEVDVREFDIRILSFATKLKQFCMEVLGLSLESCYGTNEQKEALTHVKWDGLPYWVRVKHAVGAYYQKPWHNFFSKWFDPRSGHMTGREVLQIFGTELIRAWREDAWADATYKSAAAAKERFVIIPDCRFPDEESRKSNVPSDIQVVSVRLLRSTHNDTHESETALDKYPTKRFDYVFDEEISLQRMSAWAEKFMKDYLGRSER